VEDERMTWTLWRGDDLLGTVHERLVPEARETRNGRRQINAVLVPDAARLPLPSETQRVVELGGSHRVSEHIREPHVSGARRAPGQAIGVWVASSDPASLQPDVPPERRLRLLDESGRVVPTRSIGILEHRPHPEHPPSERLPDGALVGGSVWLVHFTEDISAPAT
jgi:hypothetical protein